MLNHSSAYSLPEYLELAIFRAYDIRGIVGSGIDESTMYALGLAIGSDIREKGLNDVVVARDARQSSAELIRAVHHGLRLSGLQVIDIGEVASPVLYFATYHLGISSGVMLTASHNPPEYNGLKIIINGTSLTTDRIQALSQRILEKRFFLSQLPGTLRYDDVLPAYYRRIISDVVLKRRLNIVIDCGNGVAGNIAPALFRQLGCEVTTLYCDVDGSFPHHTPDPSVEKNMVDLQRCVLETKADIGLAFDGDADRLGVVSEAGAIIWPDQQMLLFSQSILKDHPGKEIIFDVKCTAHLSEKILEWGGIPIMSQTGHSLLKNTLHEKNAPLAGEMSGHIFFNDRWYGFDDGMYVGARLLEMIAAQDKTVTEIFSEFPQAVNTPELKLAVPEHEKFSIMEKIKNEAIFPGAHIIRIDGLRIEFPHGWGLVRASNTSPCLTLRFEADTQANLDDIQDIIQQELIRLGVEIKWVT
jgi:phosphomannomutase / phosphoglucomutase